MDGRREFPPRAPARRPLPLGAQIGEEAVAARRAFVDDFAARAVPADRRRAHEHARLFRARRERAREEPRRYQAAVAQFAFALVAPAPVADVGAGEVDDCVGPLEARGRRWRPAGGSHASSSPPVVARRTNRST